jgi:hypothetical protein
MDPRIQLQTGAAELPLWATMRSDAVANHSLDVGAKLAAEQGALRLELVKDQWNESKVSSQAAEQTLFEWF